MCKLFGISRQAFYQGLAREKKQKENRVRIVKQVKAIRKKHKKMGGVKLYGKVKPVFEKEKLKCGRDKFMDILNEENLQVHQRKRFIKTTQSKHGFKRYPNLVQDTVIERSEQVWVSDITFIRTKAGYVFILNYGRIFKANHGLGIIG